MKQIFKYKKLDFLVAFLFSLIFFAFDGTLRLLTSNDWNIAISALVLGANFFGILLVFPLLRYTFSKRKWGSGSPTDYEAWQE